MPPSKEPQKAWYELPPNTIPGQVPQEQRPLTQQEQQALFQQKIMNDALLGAETRGKLIGIQQGVEISKPKTFGAAIRQGFQAGMIGLGYQIGQDIGESISGAAAPGGPPWGNEIPTFSEDLRSAGGKVKEGGKKAAKFARTAVEVGKVVATDPRVKAAATALSAWWNNRNNKPKPNESSGTIIIDSTAHDSE